MDNDEVFKTALGMLDISSNEVEPERLSSSEDIWGEVPEVDWPDGQEFPDIDGYIPPRVITEYEGKQRLRGSHPKGRPEGIIVHHLAGRDGAERAMKSSIRKNSYKYDTIGSDGVICLSGAYDRYGYHAGHSYHPLFGHGVSKWFHGIEVTTAGLLEEDGGALYAWWDKRRRDPISKDDARYVKKGEWSNVTKTGWYHSFSDTQERSLAWLVKYYKLTFGRDLRYCLGHDEVAVKYKKLSNGNVDTSSVTKKNFQNRLGRKNDPGGSLSMSMDKFRALVDLEKGW